VTPNGRRPSDAAGAVVADDVRALLGTLREGEEVGGFELVRVDPVHDQRIPLIFRRDDATARLWIVRQNTIAFEPPAQTRRYAVIYRCDDAEVSSETCGLLSMAVAERLRQTEVEAPVPAEMAPR
jgi:hypothetical protein